MKAFNIQLSGSPKLYAYASGVDLKNGDRVVIANKLKEDGALSLSIGTVAGPAADAAVSSLNPVLQVIDAKAIADATATMQRLASGG